MHTLMLRLLTIGVLVGLYLPATAQTYQWATGAKLPPAVSGNFYEVGAAAVATDSAGRVYTAYRHTWALTVGGQTWPGTQPQSFTIVKHEATGQFAGALLHAVNANALDLKTDAAGNVYAIGWLRSTLTADSVTLTSATGLKDWFVGKWNAGGNLQWLRQGVVDDLDSVNFTGGALAVDAAGNVTATGIVRGSVTFGTTTIAAAPGVKSLFMVQFDSAGAVRWGRASTQFLQGRGAWVTVRQLDADPTTGDLVVVGRCREGFSWGGLPAIGTNSTPCNYWMRLTRAGDLLTSFRIDNRFTPFVRVADNGHSYLGLSVYNSPGGAISLNGTPLTLPASAFGTAVVARLNAAGIPQWTRVLSLATAPNTEDLDLTALAAANYRHTPVCYLAGYYSSRSAGAMFDGLALPPTDSARADGLVVALDGLSGATRWVLPVGGGLADAYVTQIDASSNGHVALAGGANGGFWGTRYPLAFGPTIRLAGAAHQSAFTAKLLLEENTVRGAVFVDTNRNGVFDAPDAPYPGAVVELQPTGTFHTTDPAGEYTIVTALGTYSPRLLAPPLYYTLVAQGPGSATFTTYGNQSGGHNFALQPIAGQQDVRVTLTTLASRVRPGSALRYYLTYQNVGTVAIAAADVRLTLDPRLTYRSHSPVGGTFSGQTLTVPYVNLLPRQTRTVVVETTLDSTAMISTMVVSTATAGPLTGDLTPADNTQTSTTLITASLDPNSITVNYAALTPAQVQSGEWLDYTIHFQNLGTDTAFSVLLRDTLPTTHLNLGTLEMLDASHHWRWDLQAGGVLRVQFPNIRLPHQAANGAGSMGFVRFRIRPVATLALGDVVANRAHIFFDFNAPVTTNTALTRVQLLTARPPALTPPLAAVWPNPATGTLHVALAPHAGAGSTVTLLDGVGRAVRTAPAAPAADQRPRRYAFEVAGLAPGLYMVRVANGQQQWSQRVVVQ